jgi:enoyl-CoA hydratase/carnithine racemase
VTEIVELETEAHVARVTLNRPDRKNAVDMEVFEALGEIGDELANDRSVRVVVLSGRGEHFCAGIDTALFTHADPAVISRGLRPMAPSPANLFQRAACLWRELPMPVICSIHGVAFGAGLQIALGADIRYAAPDARLSIMEVAWGLVPDMALTVTARGVVPADRLKELAFSGRIVSGSDAVALGLVTAARKKPLEDALELAREIAGHSPDAVRGIKRLINEGMRADEVAALGLEAKLQSGILGSRNQLEAVHARLEKRSPEFSDEDLPALESSKR